MNDNQINVAAVCGKEVRIYGEPGANGVRPLLKVREFPTHGAAREFAQEYEDSQRAGQRRR